MKNLCGNCNVCCIVLEVTGMEWRETNKAAGERCDKLCDKGCSCYLNRPKQCKEFDCVWLKLSKNGLQGSDLRPDKIGFLVRIINEEIRDLLAIDELYEGAINFNNLKPPQKKFFDILFGIANNSNKETKVVIKPFGHNRHYLLGN